MRSIFPCLLALALIPRASAAQESFDVSADRLYGRRAAGTELVVLKDNVRIVHGSTVATADSGYYDKAAETLKLMGRARVMERGVEVRGEECVYRRLERKVFFPRGMQALDSLSMVVADSGSYDLNTEVLEVAGSVYYAERGRTIHADRAMYDRGSEFIEASGSVVIVDSDYGATLSGDRVTYDRTLGYGVAVGSPVLEISGEGMGGEESVPEGEDGSAGEGEEQGAVETGGAGGEGADARDGGEQGGPSERPGARTGSAAEDGEGALGREAGAAPAEDRDQETASAEDRDQDMLPRDSRDQQMAPLEERDMEAAPVEGRDPDAAPGETRDAEAAPAEGRDPVIVHSDSMEVYVDAHRAVAVGNVRILRGSVVGTGARAIFLDEEDTTILTGDPLLVDGESSLSGETITMFTRNGKISTLEAAGTARSVYTTEGGETSELTGEKVVFSFAEGELREMFVDGPARGIFYPPAADTAAEFTNEVEGETITITFADREAESAVVTGGVRGTYRIQGDLSEEPVSYECNTLEYRVASATMVLDGGAKVEYGNTRLHSPLIEYDSRSYTLYAPSEPVLWEGDDKITGTSLAYNLRTRRGSISSGGTNYEKGYYTGKLVRKVGERELNVSSGTYTTCDEIEDPHYSFTSSQMKVYVDDKVIVKPVVLRVRGMPVFWLPFYMFPIKRGRHSGILMPRVEFGFDDARGRFIRNVGYYWAPNDYMDLAMYGDYYERDRWLLYLESRYKLRYVLSGAFNASFTQELDTDNRRWDLEGAHQQTIGEEGRLVVRADFVSDESYRTDTSQDLEKSLRRILESSLSYTKRWEKSSLSLALDRKENLDTEEISQKLPTLSFLMNRRTLIPAPDGADRVHQGTYISGGLSLANTSSSTPTDETERQQARLNADVTSNLNFAGGTHILKNSSALSGDRRPGDEWCPGCSPAMTAHSAFDNRTDFTFRLSPWASLNLNPSLTASVTLFDEDREGERLPLRFMYWFSLSSNVTFYRTYLTSLGPLKALRHVVLPSISYTHRPDFSRYSGRFYSLPGVQGGVGESILMNINLENRLQAKLERGENVEKINNFLVLETSTTADFLYKDKGRRTPFSTINNNLRFYPPGGVRFDITFTNNPEDLSFETLDLTTRFAYTGRTGLLPGFAEPAVDEYADLKDLTGMTPTQQFQEPTGRPWDVSVIYRLSKTFETGIQAQWIELQTGFNLSRNWRVDYSSRYNATDREIAYQEFAIYRDLHCWQARFVRRFQNGRWDYYFRVNIKAHPDLYAERGLRSLHRSY